MNNHEKSYVMLSMVKMKMVKIQIEFFFAVIKKPWMKNDDLWKSLGENWEKPATTSSLQTWHATECFHLEFAFGFSLFIENEQM